MLSNGRLDVLFAAILTFVIGGVWVLTLMAHGFWSALPLVFALVCVLVLIEGIQVPPAVTRLYRRARPGRVVRGRVFDYEQDGGRF